jgi:hypothetical protein
MATSNDLVRIPNKALTTITWSQAKPLGCRFIVTISNILEISIIAPVENLLQTGTILQDNND